MVSVASTSWARELAAPLLSRASLVGWLLSAAASWARNPWPTCTSAQKLRVAQCNTEAHAACCRYTERPLDLTPDLFDYAVSVYFTLM